MKYTVIPADVGIEVGRIKKNDLDRMKDMEKILSHPSLFAHYMLGITPYRYQHLFLRRFQKNFPRQSQRIMICKSRQIGISWGLAFLSIWFASTNQAESGPHKDTKVGIISKSDKQAIKLMALIQKLVFESPSGLGEMIQEGRRAPLNKTEIHFEKGFIKCFPPTRAAAGETFDLLILDEAAFVEDEILSEVLEPTVIAVDGKIILSSTPKGQKGYFYELFDPNDVKPKHEYKRFYFHWHMCENELMKKVIRTKEEHAKLTGSTKSFDQEYNALFTVDLCAFFEDKDIEKGINESLAIEYEYHKNPCAISIDYGINISRTCITVVTKVDGKIKLLFQFSKTNLDDNLLMDSTWEHSIPRLKERYDMAHVVVDDCPQGNRTNQQLENEGYPVLRFNFKSDTSLGERNRGYYLFRSALKQKMIEYPNIRELIGEMKTLQEESLRTFTRIKAPRNYPDDRCDGIMMACHPFLKEDEGFGSFLVEYDKIVEKLNKKVNDGRHDDQWEKLVQGPDDYGIYQETRGRPIIQKG